MAREFTPQELGLAPVVEAKTEFTPEELGLAPVKSATPTPTAKVATTQTEFTPAELGLAVAQPTDADKFTLAKAKETQDRNERLGLNIIPKAPVVASTSPTKSSFDTKSLTDLGYETDPNKQLLKTMVGDVTTPNTKVMDKRYELAQQSMEYAKKQANIAADQAKKSGAPDADVKTIFEDTYSKSLSPVSGISAADAEYQIQSDYRMRPEMKGITETAQGLKRAGALGYHALAQAGGGQLRFMQDMLGIDSSNTAESLDKINKTVEAIGTPTSHPQAIIEGAISSILQQAPAMGMGVATGSEIPVLGSMFLNSFGQTYDDSRRKGLDTVDSTIRSGAYATLEVLGEKLGLDEFMKGLKASAKGVPASKLSEYFTDALLKQLPGEELTYMGQFAVDKGYGLNPKAGIKDFFDGAIDTMGATLIQGGLMFGGAHAVNSVANAKNTPKDYQDQLAQATKDSAMQQWQMMREGKPLQPRATVQKDILAKASELTTAEEQPATTEVLAPEVTVPTEARIEPTLGEPTPVVPATEAEQHAELVKKYRDKGQTAENALLLANLEIEDKKELENAGRTDTGPTGVSAPISGPTIAGGTTGGTEQPVGTTMAGVGSTAGTTATGTTVQPSTLSPTIAPLYTAMQESGKDFKNPIQVRKFLEKTVFGGDTALFEDTLKLAPNLVKDLFAEWKAPTQAAPEVTTPTEVVGETPTAPTVEAPQEATPTPTAEQPAPERIQPSEESASINSIQQELSQIVSPERLQSNPPVVVNDYADLPVSDEIKQQAIDGGVAAFVDPSTGTDYYIASQIPSNNVKGKILHEQGGHLGLTNLIGAERLNILANQVQEWANGSNGTLENQIAKEAVFLADQSGEEEGTDRYNQEVVAYFTEIAVNDYGIDPLQTQPAEKQKVAAWLKELWNGVLAALTKLNYNPESLTTADIVTIVKGAARIKATKATAAGVEKAMPVKFTNKMAQQVYDVMDDSELVRSEIANEPKEEPKLDPRIQASANDLNKKLGFTQPGIDRLFTELFYDQFKKYGESKEALDNFVNDIRVVTPPVEYAVITPERIMATLPEFNLINIEGNRYNSGVQNAWLNPEAAAERESELINEKRADGIRQTASEVRHKIGDAWGNLIQQHNSDTLTKASILIPLAMSKYTMAGNKVVTMTKKDGYVPIPRAKISEPLVEKIIDNLESGISMKDSLGKAYTDVVLAPRNDVIETELGPSLTGWMHFSNQNMTSDAKLEEAKRLEVVTSDTGQSAKSPWCVGRSAESHGLNELSKGDLWVYLKEGNSVLAGHVKPGANEAYRWYGLGSSQSTLPQHEKYKSELPVLPNPTSTTEVVEPIKSEDEVRDKLYKDAEEVIRKAVTGDVEAIKQITQAKFKYHSSDTVEYALRYGLDIDDTTLLSKLFNVPEEIITILTKSAESIDVDNDVPLNSLYPEISSAPNQALPVTHSVRNVPLKSIPREILTGIQKYIDVHARLLEDRTNIFDALKINEAQNGTLQSTNGLGKLQNIVSKAIYKAYPRAVGETSDASEARRTSIRDITDTLDDWIRTLPRIEAQGALDIDKPVSDIHNDVVLVTPINGVITGGVVELNIADIVQDYIEGPNPTESYVTLNKKYAFYDRKTEFKSKIIDLVAKNNSERIKAIAPRIQASKAKKVKINKAVQTLATSKNAEEVKSALTELMDSPTWENAKDIVKSTLETATVVSLPATLPMLSTSQIVDIIGDRIPHLDEVTSTVDKMIVMRSKMMAQTAHILQPWSKFAAKHTKAGALLSDVMILSTLTSVDPTLHNTLAEALQDDDKLVNLRLQVASAVNPRSKAAYTGQITTRVSDINEVYNIWNKLANVANGEGQEIYKVVKDHFETIYNLYRAILNERINALNIPGDINDASTPKGKLMAAIKLSYEGAKKIGVYFPLMRTGEYWMNEGTGANDPFYMFESQWERDRFYRQRIKAMQKAGDTRTADEIHAAGDIDKGNKAEDIRSKIEASSTMLKDIFEIIDAQKPLVSTGTSKEAAIAASQQRDDLKDSIYQLYLLTMPESSFRKRYLHRKGKAGFSTDNIRNFATHGFTTANQLSRLKYGPVLINLMESAKAAIQGGPHDAKLEVYLDEIGLRVKDEIAPVQATSNLAKTFNTGASITNQVAFIWSLTSIKSAFNNMTALSVYGLPVLSAHYGAGPAFKGMAKYGAVWSHLTIKDSQGSYIPPSVGLSKHVQSNPVLAAAFEEAFEQGVTEITRAFDIISQSNTPSAAHQNAVSRGRRIAIALHTALFHHSERLNREIMYMTDFELGYAKNIKDGMFPGIGMAAYNKAVDDAVKHTYESMFNYSRFNRPRIMRPAGMRVITQFEFFPQQACGYLIKNVITALPLIKSNTAKKEAATKLFGTLLMTFMWGGLVTLPLFSMAIGLIKKWLQSDDDEAKKAGIHIFENKDPKLWFTTVYLPQTFGNDTNFAKVFGEHNWNLVLERGPISTATNIDFGASTSLDNLFFRDTKYNPSLGMSFDNYWNALKGPGINKYEDFVKAIDDYNTGHFKEMLDKILPPLERGAFDTYTWATKGIISKNDSLKVMDKHEITFGMLAAKAAGFNPLNVARITQRNFAVEQLNAEAKDKRSKIMKRMDLELTRGDTKAFQKSLREALEFSKEYPDLEIKPSSIASSLVKKAKVRAMAQNGLIVDIKSYPKLFNIIKAVKPKATMASEQARYDAMVKADEAANPPDEEPMEIEINGGQ